MHAVEQMAWFRWDRKLGAYERLFGRLIVDHRCCSNQPIDAQPSGEISQCLVLQHSMYVME